MLQVFVRCPVQLTYLKRYLVAKRKAGMKASVVHVAIKALGRALTEVPQVGSGSHPPPSSICPSTRPYLALCCVGPRLVEWACALGPLCARRLGGRVV